MAASLVLVQFLIHFVKSQPEQLEQLREMFCNILRTCGLPIFLTSIQVAWVHITMAKIVVSRDDGAPLPLRAEELPEDIDVQGAAPCRIPGSLHLLRDVPYAKDLKQEIPDCMATVCKIMQSQELCALPAADQDYVEKYLADWMFVLQICLTVLESETTDWS